MDRLRHLTGATSAFATAVVALAALCGIIGCNKPADPPAATSSRAAAVRPKAKSGVVNDTGGFCEKKWAAGEAPKFAWGPERPLPDGTAPAPALPTDRWTWVNLWATWCVPCVEEMGLLGRWSQALAREGRPVDLQLLSIDRPEDAQALADRIKKGLPGTVRWLQAEADFEPYLDTLHLDRGAAIPIHALVDPAGKLRCVRVGAISGQDYAAIKSILGSG